MYTCRCVCVCYQCLQRSLCFPCWSSVLVGGLHVHYELFMTEWSKASALPKLRSETPTEADTERQHFIKHSFLNKRVWYYTCHVHNTRHHNQTRTAFLKSIVSLSRLLNQLPPIVSMINLAHDVFEKCRPDQSEI